MNNMTETNTDLSSTSNFERGITQKKHQSMTRFLALNSQKKMRWVQLVPRDLYSSFLISVMGMKCDVLQYKPSTCST